MAKNVVYLYFVSWLSLRNLSLLLGLLLPFLSAGNEPSFQSFKDNQYYSSIQIPADWNLSSSQDSSSFLRLSAVSPTGNEAIFIYSVKVASDMTAETLLSKDTGIFTNLGAVISSNAIKKHWWTGAKKVERAYAKSSSVFFLKQSM